MRCLECETESAEATPICAWCGAEVDGARLAEWVDARKFSTTRLRPGYEQEEVDAFLDEIRDTFLETGEPPLTPDAIRTKQFSTTRLRPGYEQEEVDDFLDEAESRLAGQASTQVHVAYQPSVAGDHAVGQGVGRGLHAGEVVVVGILILLVLVVVVVIPLLTGWVPGSGG
jgi:DivIVA domain-containing protein